MAELRFFLRGWVGACQACDEGDQPARRVLQERDADQQQEQRCEEVETALRDDELDGFVFGFERHDRARCLPRILPQDARVASNDGQFLTANTQITPPWGTCVVVPMVWSRRAIIFCASTPQPACTAMYWTPSTM